MLKQLRELKQGQKTMDDFLTEFENLKILAKISDDHVLEILQQNVQWEAMKQFIYVYGPPASYQSLINNLTEIGNAEIYLKSIHCPQFQPFCPRPTIPSTSAKQLPQGTPMDVDRQQHPAANTRHFEEIVTNVGKKVIQLVVVQLLLIPIIIKHVSPLLLPQTKLQS